MKKTLSLACITIFAITQIAAAADFHPISSVSSSTEANDFWAVSFFSFGSVFRQRRDRFGTKFCVRTEIGPPVRKQGRRKDKRGKQGIVPYVHRGCI